MTFLVIFQWLLFAVPPLLGFGMLPAVYAAAMVKDVRLLRGVLALMAGMFLGMIACGGLAFLELAVSYRGLGGTL